MAEKLGGGISKQLLEKVEQVMQEIAEIEETVTKNKKEIEEIRETQFLREYKQALSKMDSGQIGSAEWKLAAQKAQLLKANYEAKYGTEKVEQLIERLSIMKH